MVKLLVLLLLSVGQLHAASLSLLPEKNQIMQGRSLTVNMLYVGPTSPDDLNVKRWQDQVFIKKGEREEQRLMDGRVEVKQRLTLYPKRSGLLKNALSTRCQTVNGWPPQRLQSAGRGPPRGG